MIVHVTNRVDLISAFGNLGTKVGGRTGPDARTHEQQEWWCLRHHLFTLAANDQLEYPITIQKGERPDFCCTFAGREIGIEVAQATHPLDQRELTRMENEDGCVFVGQLGGRFPDGGGNTERAWWADVLKAVRRKSRKVRSYPNPLPEYSLLLYSNSNAQRLIFDWPKAFEELDSKFGQLWRIIDPAIKSLAIICSRWLLLLEPGNAKHYALWNDDKPTD